MGLPGRPDEPARRIQRESQRPRMRRRSGEDPHGVTGFGSGRARPLS